MLLKVPAGYLNSIILARKFVRPNFYLADPGRQLKSQSLFDHWMCQWGRTDYSVRSSRVDSLIVIEQKSSLAILPPRPR